MKKFLLSLSLGLSLMIAPVQKSEAAVGLAISAPVLVTGAALVTIVSGTIAVDPLVTGGAIVDVFCKSLGDCVLLWLYSTIYVLPAGLVLLDGEGALAFQELQQLKGATAEELEIYNSELDQLNAVNQTITHEVAANKKADAQALWSDYASTLSPETMKVAALTTQKMLASLKKK